MHRRAPQGPCSQLLQASSGGEAAGVTNADALASSCVSGDRSRGHASLETTAFTVCAAMVLDVDFSM